MGSSGRSTTTSSTAAMSGGSSLHYTNNNAGGGDGGGGISGGSMQQQASPCAACKLLRRRCVESCTFAPHFPADDPLKFASVHRVFGASNVSKMLQELPVDQRGDAVSSMVYEANARIRDPIYGCVGAIANLQRQVLHLQTQLAVSQAQTVYAQLQCEHFVSNMVTSSKDTSTRTTLSHEEDDTSSLRLPSDTFTYE
ncbi:hypothetical protein GOP47_0004069 [Adiantum capillus-veneris]|uniref:LOB domain-containing protein n=1 Tax=Adiantum capillus-veneris TaxID=13818 RepID=A0A9D4V7Y3_ADICA|nr:hypothetical protein GOP47_0004069 [Adiantum capillus-veneris]